MATPRQYLLLFAHPRSGSTTLAKALELQSEIRMSYEPFASERVEGMAHLDRMLTHIVRAPWNATGIKHVYNFAWPFQSGHAEEYNKYLLLKPGWLPIFLWRRNLFAAVLSNAIAEQLNAWDTPGSRDLLRQGRTFAPIAEYRIRNRLRALDWEINTYRSALVEAGKPFIEITYEEIYGESVTSEEKVSRINAILAAAGYPELDGEEAFARLASLLSPENKLNSQATYQLIPNFKELALAFDASADIL